MNVRLLTTFCFEVADGFCSHIVLCSLLFCLGMKRRSHFGLRLLPLLPFICFPTLFYMIQGRSFYQLPCFQIGWYAYIFVPIFFLATFLLLFCFDAPYLQILYHCTAGYTLQNLIYIFKMILQELGFGRLPAPLYRISMLATSALIILVVYLIFIRKIVECPVSVDNRIPLPIAFSTLMIINITCYWAWKFDYFTPAAMIYSVLCSLLLLVVQFNIFDKSRFRQEQLVMEQLYSAMERQQRLSADSIDLINRKCHDMKHQLALLQRASIGENEKDSIIQDLAESIMIYDSIAKTGNEFLDTILTEKSLQCEQHHIDFTYIADGSTLSFMAGSDLYTLFGNALDNAIECELKEDVSKRMITLNSSVKGAFLVVSIENYCTESVSFEDGLPLSSKPKDGYHGFGTRSMQYIIKKYKGHLKMHLDEEFHRFRLTMFFPT